MRAASIALGFGGQRWWWQTFTAMSLVILCTTSELHADTAPIMPGNEGQRAFDDLTKLYKTGGKPDVTGVLKALYTDDSEKRASAGRYFLALCEQSLEDDRTNRSGVLHVPWYKNMDRGSDYIREYMAVEMEKRGAFAETLPALRYLLEKDDRVETRVHAVNAVCEVLGPESDQLLISLISPPNPVGKVVVVALQEIAARRLMAAAPQLPALAMHCRSDVRQAAMEAAEKLGVRNLPAFDPEEAVRTNLGDTLDRIADMVYFQIPPEAKFAKIEVKHPEYNDWVYTVRGWASAPHGTTLSVIDEFGEKKEFPAAQTRVTEISLADYAQTLRELREVQAKGDWTAADALMGTMFENTLGTEFGTENVWLSEALVSAWSYRRGDTATAAAVLLPRMETLDDQRGLYTITRDRLGNTYREDVLIKMVDERDYAEAIGFAQHLSRPLFDGFLHQDEARTMASQLTVRNGLDFQTLTLPTPAQWRNLKSTMSRDERIRFLADRLRLLNCRQPGWPAETNFYVQQRSLPMGGTVSNLDIDWNRGVEWINPMTELYEMKLEPSDLGVLLPYLACEDYVLAYNAWRPWAPSWKTFQANELVTDLVNDAAGQKLADIYHYYGLSEDGRPAFIAAMIAKSRSLHSRPVRAILDVDAVRENWVNPLLGVACLALGAGWLAWRRKVRPIAWLGAISLGMLGCFAIAQPALQQQRTLLDTAYAASANRSRVWNALSVSKWGTAGEPKCCDNAGCDWLLRWWEVCTGHGIPALMAGRQRSLLRRRDGLANPETTMANDDFANHCDGNVHARIRRARANFAYELEL